MARGFCATCSRLASKFSRSRPDKHDRRKRSKNDDLDAQNAAHAAFAARRTVTPKSRDGMIESSRVLKISAHASGLAIDVGSFELSNGRTLTIAPKGDEHLRATVDAIRVASCGWFTTVLGPGSDEAHTDHMHVDILQRGSSDRFRICQ